MTKFDPATLGLVLVDMQNDFLHPQGAYGRAGQTAPAMAPLPERLARLAIAIRRIGAWTVSTHFTLVPDKDGTPFISDHLKRLRPFLGKGDFVPGSFGHDVIDELKPIDLQVEKVAYDAFYMSRLDWVLRKAGIETLVFGGIVTNGGVESTVRAAHVRGYTPIVLADGCAAFSPEAHDNSIGSMSTISEIVTCDEIRTMLEAH